MDAKASKMDAKSDGKKNTESGAYGLDDWTQFEQKLSSGKDVIEMLKVLGNSGAFTKELEKLITTMGDEFSILRTDAKLSKIFGLGPLVDKSKSGSKSLNSAHTQSEKKPKAGKPGANGKSGKVSGMTREEIIGVNSKAKTDKEVALLKERFQSGSGSQSGSQSGSNSGSNSGILTRIPESNTHDSIELTIMSLMGYMHEFARNIKECKEEAIYDLVFGIAKIIDSMRDLIVRDTKTAKHVNIQPQLITDLETCYSNFMSKINEKGMFDVVLACRKYPKLLCATSYDRVLPGLAMSPYPSQISIINGLRSAFKTNQGLLACLNTLTGEGKTTLIVAIAQLALSIRATGKDYEKSIEVIYCCSEKLKTVRTQVGQCAFNGLIPFGVATKNENPDKPSKPGKFSTRNVAITDNYNCIKMGTPRILVMADIQSAIHLLSEPGASTKYILVLDEPTVGLDQPHSLMVDYLAQIYAVMPKWTIFSTATAPAREQIPMLEQLFTSKYPGAAIDYIKSTRVQIGSEISDLDGNIFIPHGECKSLDDLSRVISKIESDIFLQKPYTANIVQQMDQLLVSLSKEYGFSLTTGSNPVPDFKEYMMQPGHMNQQSIQNLGLQILKKVLGEASKMDECIVGDDQSNPTISSQIVTKFCSLGLNKKGIDFTTLASGADQFSSQTLIVTSDPENFFNKYFNETWINDMHELIGNKDKSFASIFAKYSKDLEKYKKDLEKIERGIEMKSKSKGSGDCTEDGAVNGKSSKEAVDHKYEREDGAQSLKKPKILIPESFIIGSPSYMRTRSGINPRIYHPNEDIDWEAIHCPDDYKTGLDLGIGIFAPGIMSPSYTRKVIDLASNGELAYIIANDDITYGTNYPIENIIVDNTCMSAHSAKTIFQVFARAGRPGKSWRANVFADRKVLAVINDYIFNKEYVDIEAKNMNKALVQSVLIPVIKKSLATINVANCEIKRLKLVKECEDMMNAEKKRIEQFQKQAMIPVVTLASSATTSYTSATTTSATSAISPSSASDNWRRADKPIAKQSSTYVLPHLRPKKK